MDMTKAQLTLALNLLVLGKYPTEIGARLGLDPELVWTACRHFGHYTKNYTFVQDVPVPYGR